MIEPADTIVAAPDDGTSNSSDSEVDNVREDPVIKILRGFNGVSKETIGTIRGSNVTNRDLSSLRGEDLELFGVKDENTRFEMLDAFSKQKSQEEYFEKYLKEMDLKMYQESAYRNARDHLQTMLLVLETSKRKLHFDSVERNRLVADNVYTSTINVKTLKSMLETIDDMCKGQQNADASKKWLHYCTTIAALSAISTFAIYKIFM